LMVPADVWAFANPAHRKSKSAPPIELNLISKNLQDFQEDNIRLDLESICRAFHDVVSYPTS
jgi:hypothetical protein